MRYLRQDVGSDHFLSPDRIDLITADTGFVPISGALHDAALHKISRHGTFALLCLTRESSPLDMRYSHAIGRVDHFRFDSLALGRAEAIDEQNSVEMIVLVLNRTRKESTRLELKHLAVQRLGSHAHSSGPGHVAPHSREAQAALNTDFRLSERLYFGVDQHQGHMLVDLRSLGHQCEAYSADP